MTYIQIYLPISPIIRTGASVNSGPFRGNAKTYAPITGMRSRLLMFSIIYLLASKIILCTGKLEIGVSGDRVSMPIPLTFLSTRILATDSFMLGKTRLFLYFSGLCQCWLQPV